MRFKEIRVRTRITQKEVGSMTGIAHIIIVKLENEEVRCVKNSGIHLNLLTLLTNKKFLFYACESGVSTKEQLAQAITNMTF